jgi:hypothetical protein
MDVSLARQYHKKLAELFGELQLAQTVGEREPIVMRMQNIVGPLYVVHSGAGQHMEEALRKLKYPDLAVVNAAHHTINSSLQQLYEAIEQQREPHFLMHGEPRLYMKPVVEPELRSLVEKNRLFHSDHRPFIDVLEASEEVEDVFSTVESETLRPVLARLGFPDAQALLFFRSHALPNLSRPVEAIPSLKLARIRSGIPISVVKHRVL